MNKHTELENLLLKIEHKDLFYIFVKVLIKGNFSSEELEQIAKISIDLIDDEYSVEFVDFLNSVL